MNTLSTSACSVRSKRMPFAGCGPSETAQCGHVVLPAANDLSKHALQNVQTLGDGVRVAKIAAAQPAHEVAVQIFHAHRDRSDVELHVAILVLLIVVVVVVVVVVLVRRAGVLLVVGGSLGFVRRAWSSPVVRGSLGVVAGEVSADIFLWVLLVVGQEGRPFRALGHVGSRVAYRKIFFLEHPRDLNTDRVKTSVPSAREGRAEVKVRTMRLKASSISPLASCSYKTRRARRTTKSRAANCLMDGVARARPLRHSAATTPSPAPT